MVQGTLFNDITSFRFLTFCFLFFFISSFFYIPFFFLFVSTAGIDTVDDETVRGLAIVLLALL